MEPQSPRDPNPLPSKRSPWWRWGARGWEQLLPGVSADWESMSLTALRWGSADGGQRDGFHSFSQPDGGGKLHLPWE